MSVFTDIIRTEGFKRPETTDHFSLKLFIYLTSILNLFYCNDSKYNIKMHISIVG